MAVMRKVRRCSGGVYDLGLPVVWCSKYRRPVLGGGVAVRLLELIEAKAADKGWEIVTSVGAVGADTVEKYFDTQWERPWTKKQKEDAGRAPHI